MSENDKIVPKKVQQKTATKTVEVEKKWYVLRAISGKESKVREYLEADIKNSDLKDYVSQVLIPTEKVYTVRNGKKKIGRAHV